MQADDDEVEEEAAHVQYKVIVVGDPGVGKTSVITRYTEGAFSDDYKATIGADFALKEIEWSGNTSIHLQLWDIGGQERFRSMTRVYYKEANAVIIVFDVSVRRTFDTVAKWKADVDDKATLPDGRALPAFLFANKTDMGAPAVADAEIEAFAREQGFLGWCKTSAKTGQNIDNGISLLLKHMMRTQWTDDDASGRLPPEEADGEPSTRSFKLRKFESSEAGGAASGGTGMAGDNGCC